MNLSSFAIRAIGFACVPFLIEVRLHSQTPVLDWAREHKIPQRFDHAMCFDAARESIVLYGGRGPSGAPLTDTWVWDGNGWKERKSPTTPGGRAAHAMAYDLARDRTVLFGGGDDRTWEWDGSQWLQRHPALSPSAREHHAMAYDVLRQRVVLFGGKTGNTLLTDT